MIQNLPTVSNIVGLPTKMCAEKAELKESVNMLSILFTVIKTVYVY